MADITNDIWSEVDAENNSSGLQPGFPEGMNPSAVNDAARALMGAIRRWYERTNATQTSTGSANAQILTYTVNPLSYVVGDIYRFIPGFTNTAATTLTIGSLTDVDILCHGEPLSGGEIVVNVVAVVAFDSSNTFQLLNPQNRFFGDLQVLGDLAVGGLVSVAGELTADHIATVHDVFVGDDLHVAGAILGASETLTGDLSAANITATNNLTVGNDLTVSGDEHVTGKLFLGEKSINIAGVDINILPADVTFFISPSGSDSTGDGSFATPWATANHAYATVSANTNFGVHVVTINMLPGTYSATSTFFTPGVGNWALISSTGIPADVTIAVTGFEQDGVHVNGTAQCRVAGITVGATGGYALVSSGPSQLTLNSVNVTQSNAQIVAYDGGTTVVLGNYAILGDATFHYDCSHATIVASQSANPIVVTSSGTRAFTAFARCDGAGYIRAVSGTYSGVTATGERFSIDSNSVVETAGEDPATFFPGDATGVTANGGVFV